MNRQLTAPTLCSLAALPLLAAAAVLALLTLRGAPPAGQYGVLLPLAYLIGALPWGYVVLYLRRGIDIREYGSGRTGMSNALRTAGMRVAGLVLALDFGKGVAAVLLARLLMDDPLAETAAGLLALAGHNWPVFLGFRGGRGIAPGLGGMAVIAPLAAALGVLVFIPVTFISRYLSLGSMLGVVSACGLLTALVLLKPAFLSFVSPSLLTPAAHPYHLIYGLLGGAVILWQHRDNIQRIAQGTERRIGAPATRIE